MALKTDLNSKVKYWCHLPPVLLCCEEERESVLYVSAEEDLRRYIFKEKRGAAEPSRSLGSLTLVSLPVSPGSISVEVSSLQLLT